MVASCAAAGAGCTRSASTPPRMTARMTADSQRLRGMSRFSSSGVNAAPDSVRGGGDWSAVGGQRSNQRYMGEFGPHVPGRPCLSFVTKMLGSEAVMPPPVERAVTNQA
ncbi:hypothetical protein [Streptosporangium subroseum]|uniref:hypothetical protein n=1 Tax=Streptosporangium subroseum TaxID=106412 RepID=UPI003B8367E9